MPSHCFLLLTHLTSASLLVSPFTEIGLVLALVVATVILFATERLPVDVVALLIMATLLASRLITPEEGIAGFSNTATVTVGAMFILSAGLFRTGAVNFIGRQLQRVFRFNFWVALVLMMVLIGVISAFVNNTAAVAIFLPLLLGIARELKVSASRLLMPLSFASMFGGVCTLIGTSTNVLVSSIAERHGEPAFRMFEFTRLGLVFFAVGVLYMLLVGVRLIPARRGAGDLTQSFEMADYLAEIVLQPEAKSVGKKLSESPLVREVDLEVLEVVRGDRRLRLPPSKIVLEEGDVLRVRTNVREIRKLQEREGIALKPEVKWSDAELESEETVLEEAVVAPGSVLDGRSLAASRFRHRFGATVLAIRHRGQVLHDNLERIRLRAGDALLLEVPRERVEALKERGPFVLVSEVELPTFRQRRLVPALAIMVGVVGAAALGILPIVATAVIGSVLMIVTGCLSAEEAYQSIQWKVIFLLAGVLTLGVALEKTGAARLVADGMISTVGAWGPVALVAAFYLLTSLLTEAMSNNATAALLAPIAIGAAETLGLNPRPFLMAVTFAASSSFLTPVGYQTNTMIYGPGQYQFTDFVRVGAPLNLLFWLTATLLIPRFWPF